MPLDTSTYSLALLRLDGRRWNELRRIHAQISTQAAADGSSYLEMGNTKVICTVAGPAEGRTGGAARGGAGSEAKIEVEIGFAGFSGVDRKRRGRGDKRTAEMCHTLQTAFSSLLLTHLYPHSTISISIHILSQDGSVLAASINAATIALIDAGIPMSDYLVACTAASSPTTADDEVSDPLLDLNGLEEQELPFLTVGTVGGSERVSVLVMETRVRMERVEGMLAVGVQGCKRVKEILDGVVREYGKRAVR
ncbi:ribosomal protein S5 domain 2-like protein [Lepidopterella palustris CBS 459.81]|uniref:Ribosomal RNA-processing protein 41 n=1 Tax=Lepidopterella palustris CBS 459.81 TaxID=1314670 RepID=A0A8E2JF73_9PEZI|nr:ribosomal protein S5 domain 2-like protein [Lepidopterella palustris CBS 459.81]